MAITKANKKETENKAGVNFDIEVTRAKECENGNVSFDMVVNGVNVYGCFYKTVEKKDGTTFDCVDFPQHKVGDKWLHYVYFKTDAETIKKIEDAIKAKLGIE